MNRRALFKTSAILATGAMVGCDSKGIDSIELVADTPSLPFNHPPLYFDAQGYRTPLAQVTAADLDQDNWRKALASKCSEQLTDTAPSSPLELAFCLMLAPNHTHAKQWFDTAAAQLASSQRLADWVIIEGLGVYTAHIDTPDGWQQLLDQLLQLTEVSNDGWYNFNQPQPAFEAGGNTLTTECMALIKLKWQWRCAMKLKQFDAAFEAQIEHLRQKDALKYTYLNPDEIFWLLADDGDHLAGFEAFNLWAILRADLITVPELPSYIQQIPITSVGVLSIDKSVSRPDLALQPYCHSVLGASLLRSLGRNTELQFEQLALGLSLNNAPNHWLGGVSITKPHDPTGSSAWFTGNNSLNAAAIYGLLSGNQATAWN